MIYDGPPKYYKRIKINHNDTTVFFYFPPEQNIQHIIAAMISAWRDEQTQGPFEAQPEQDEEYWLVKDDEATESLSGILQEVVRDDELIYLVSGRSSQSNLWIAPPPMGDIVQASHPIDVGANFTLTDSGLINASQDNGGLSSIRLQVQFGYVSRRFKLKFYISNEKWDYFNLRSNSTKAIKDNEVVDIEPGDLIICEDVTFRIEKI